MAGYQYLIAQLIKLSAKRILDCKHIVDRTRLAVWLSGMLSNNETSTMSHLFAANKNRTF